MHLQKFTKPPPRCCCCFVTHLRLFLWKRSAHHSEERALFAECGYTRPVNKVERLCVMSDEKGMEANRCHGVGH